MAHVVSGNRTLAEHLVEAAKTRAVDSSRMQHAHKLGRELERRISEQGSANGGMPMAHIVIGKVLEDLDEATDLFRYVLVEVTVDGEQCEVACGVGMPEHMVGAARKTGLLETYGNGPHAFWVDASDHQDLPDSARDEVMAALREVADRLWSE
jgi:hypothetical protein